MRKAAIIVFLVVLLGAGLLYAGSGNLIVNGLLGVGPTISPQYPVDVQGDVNITGVYRINGVPQMPALTGAISGLTIANDATSPNTKIDLNGNYIGTVVLPSSGFGIDCMQSGLAGGNDLDIGTLAASTWYYIWVIYNGTAPAGLASLANGINTNPLNPILPSGFTQIRLVGVAVTDTSAHFRVFVQQGNHFVYDTFQQVTTGTVAQGWTTQVCASFIPRTSTRGWFNVFINNNNGPRDNVAVSLRKNGSSYSGKPMAQTADTLQYSAGNDWIDTDSSQQIQITVNNSVSYGWTLYVGGFELNL